MSLTKNLYRFDEVRASFLLCLKYRRKDAALFWLEELEESFYSGEARRLLLVAWSLFVGCGRLRWLVEWAIKGGEREGRLELTIQLLNCSERDGSIAVLLWGGITIKQESNSKLFEEWKMNCNLEDTEFWEQILSSYDDERLDIAMEALQTDMRAYSVIAKATGFLVAHISKKVPKDSWETLVSMNRILIQELIVSWKEGTIRQRRKMVILSDAHFGMTKRGKGADTTEELRSLSLNDLEKSVFWKRLVPEDREDDEAVEKFWDTHFASCDIPDEWSKADQEKSHGRGSTRRPDTPLIYWWNLWIPQESLYVSDGIEKEVLEWMKQEGLGSSASILDQLISGYKNPFQEQHMQYELLNALSSLNLHGGQALNHPR